MSESDHDAPDGADPWPPDTSPQDTWSSDSWPLNSQPSGSQPSGSQPSGSWPSESWPSESWPWSVLGLAAGAEARQIRSAYARALKRIDQERDAARFQALREARDEALALAAGRAKGPFEAFARSVTQPRGRGALEDADVFAFHTLDDLLDDPAARRSFASWARMLDERPLMPENQAYEFERRIVEAVNGWLDEEELPAHEVFLLLDNAFGWSAIRSNLPEFLPKLQERRLRTIINSLRG
jgi:hypothetical protein